jgi:CheY-like chemotaxis protein
MIQMDRATILVLEQNAALRELIDQALRDSGSWVLSTNDPLEALEVVQRVRIDALIVGAQPELRRRMLIAELQSIQRDLHVVDVGAADDGLDALDRCTSLAAPFALEDLCEAVALVSMR